MRRIEALTGEAARRYLLDQAGVAKALAEQFKVPVAEVPARVEALEAQRRKLEKELADAKRQLAMGGGGGGGAAGPEEIGGVKFIARVLDGVGGKDLRADRRGLPQAGRPDGVIALVGVADGKAAVTVAVTGAAPARFNAVDLAEAAVIGHGRPGRRRQARLRPGRRAGRRQGRRGPGGDQGGAGGLSGVAGEEPAHRCSASRSRISAAVVETRSARRAAARLDVPIAPGRGVVKLAPHLGRRVRA